MRHLTGLLIVTVTLSALPAAVIAAPPTRPQALTPAQFEGLQQLESQPDHAPVLDLHASYKSEREKNLELTRLSDDIWTVVYTGGFPAALLIVLIAAAPL